MAAILKWLLQKCAQCDFYLLVYGDCAIYHSNITGSIMHQMLRGISTRDLLDTIKTLTLFFFISNSFISNSTQTEKFVSNIHSNAGGHKQL